MPSSTSTVETMATQSRQEEMANAVSHGVGLLLASVSLPFLIFGAHGRGDATDIVGVIVFGASMVLLYLASTLYHAWPRGNTKRLLQVLDHSAIYLLIAGTYTPFTLGVLRGPWGWTLFGLIWAMALAGIATKLVGGIRYKKLSTAFYLVMGWLIVIAIVPLWNSIPAWGLFWLTCGGLAYTGGVKYYIFDHKPYAHLVWHVFVMTGTACHFIAVLFYSSSTI